MTYYIIIIIANILIGGMIGLTGIAGFLLPILYSGFMGMPTAQALALSFFAFLISGVLGSWNYHKAGNLDLRLAALISIGSLIGAVIGVRLNLLIDEAVVKRILYAVVLLSGISILLRKDQKEDGSKSPDVHAAIESGDTSASPVSQNKSKQEARISAPVCIIFGLVTGAVCALSGAGGPVLVMPLLVILGVPIKTAVGVSLFDSIFIAIPSCIGYSMQCDIISMAGVLMVSLISHGVGVFAGSRNTSFIKPELLKKAVAIFSILIAIVKLITG